MSRLIPILYHLIYLYRVRTMNDFLCKSVQYSGSRKGRPRKRKSVERYGGSRWYKEWFGAHTFTVVGVNQTAALNRGRHLCLAGRPSRWALAHISSCHSIGYNFGCMIDSDTLLILGVGFLGQTIWWRHSRDRLSKGRCMSNQFSH